MSSQQLLRPPQQERSRIALERIFKAVNGLAENRSFEKISVGDIAEASGVAVGSIYQRFATKDDLLWELFGHYITEAVDEISVMIDTTQAAPLDKRISNVIEVVSELFVAHRGILRSFILRLRSAPDEIPEGYLVKLSQIFKAIDQYLKVDGVSAKSAKICRSFIVAGCREHLLFSAIEGVPLGKNTQGFRNLLLLSVKAVL